MDKTRQARTTFGRRSVCRAQLNGRCRSDNARCTASWRRMTRPCLGWQPTERHRGLRVRRRYSSSGCPLAASSHDRHHPRCLRGHASGRSQTVGPSASVDVPFPDVPDCGAGERAVKVALLPCPRLRLGDSPAVRRELAMTSGKGQRWSAPGEVVCPRSPEARQSRKPREACLWSAVPRMLVPSEKQVR
jgi:hypothetical protein